jgi:SAM-dependent methyltransferase
VTAAPSASPDAAAAVEAPSERPGVRVLTTLDELDDQLRELDRLAAISDDELRRGFTEFEMRIDLELPDDPYSDEYRTAMLGFYEWLHGAPYDPSHEVTSFDVEEAADKPFPYSTQSAMTVGNHLIAVGHVIRTLGLPPRSRVLEFGPGWGNTTLALARMGHVVTAVDIEPNFVELVATRARRAHADLEVIEGDFSTIDDLDGPFDAVLFFECFHHSADHLGLLEKLHRVVAPGGKVMFAAEPVTEALPYPWGLRQDGESLWAIRKHGWMELGFRETYFVSTLERFGWSVRKDVCAETPWGVIYTATRAEEAEPI